MARTTANIDAREIEATTKAIRENAGLAHVSFGVSSHWTGGFRADSRTGAFKQAGESKPTNSFGLQSDEPPALLGDDSAPSAGDYVLKALASCYTVTIAANAAARGIELESVRLELEGDFDLHGFLGLDANVRPGMGELRVEVAIESPHASRAQLEELIEVVQERSPVRDTIANPVPVITTLAG
jgi:uncharacterized OsmC-like protein